MAFNFPTAPLEPTDIFDAAQQLLGNGNSVQNGFKTNSVPNVSGMGTRQSRVPNERAGVSTRHIVHWFVPEQPIVQMYINPKTITYSDKKAISSQRTKGGFVLQYWGEELTSLRLSGTTGTSGIEGINVLQDVYRNEQLAFDPFALTLAANKDKASLEGLGSSIGGAVGGDIGSLIGGAVGGLLQSSIDNVSAPSPSPSLAQLAFTVEMYWSGAVYRGYFQSFSVTESADMLGLFDYDIEFMVTQKRGFRQNFLPWHRSATSGPSNSDPTFGTPHSFGVLLPSDSPTPQRVAPEDRDILSSIGDVLGF